MRKAQSSLEYLISYAWAILLVLAVIGVLNYLGVLDVYSLLPNVCLTKAGFRCEDFQIRTDGTATIVMVNSQIKHLVDYGIIINGVPANCPFFEQWRDSQFLVCTFQDLPQKDEGSPFKGDISILYRFQTSVINHESRGRVFAKYEP